MKIYNTPNAVSFSSHFLNVDVGASNINGSCKIAAFNDKGELVASEKLTVFSEGEKRSEDFFERNLAKRIEAFEKKYKPVIRDSEDKLLLTVCYPGPAKEKTQGRIGFRLSNFFYDNERTRRFKREINPGSIDAQIRNAGINLAQSRHVNDMTGAGACLLSELKAKHPKTLEKEGKKILFMYPGGGLGTGMLVVDDTNYKIEPSEIQHIFKKGMKKKSIENEAGAAFLRDHFAKELKLTSAQRRILGENTRLLTDYKEFHKAFPEIQKTTFLKAAKSTIDKYMSSLAQVVATRICSEPSRLDTVVINGGIANGIRKAYNSYWGNFTSALKSCIDENLSRVGKLVGDPKKLTIIFTQIVDNTMGAQILHEGKPVGRTAQWFNIRRIVR